MQSTIRMNRGLSLIPVVLALLVGLGGCVSDYDPYAGYSAEDKAKLQADDALRAQQKKEKIQALQWKDTVTDETFAEAMANGRPPVEGIMSRGLDVFEGRWEAAKSPYVDSYLYSYAKGTYRSEESFLGKKGVYRGDFKYFQDPSTLIPIGTYVMIGTFTSDKGRTEKGIYVAENAMSEQPLTFYRATPDYLRKVESRYQQQIADWKAEQIRLQQERLARQQADQESSFSFGQILSMGLGGMMIATSDIPGSDKLEIGSALFQDVMTDGQSQALAKVTSKASGNYLSSTIGGSTGAGNYGGDVPTGFSAVLTGDTTTLDKSMNSGNQSGTSYSSAGTVTPHQDSKSTSFSFTCPSGLKSTVNISYRSDACLSAKKQMTKIYSCNMVDDFAKVSSLCQSGCGSPQCTE